MAENDIYDSKGRFEMFMKRLDTLAIPPVKADTKRKYWVKNKTNLRYYRQLADSFAAKDLSHIRRLRVLGFLNFITHHTQKDLKDLDRKDIDALMTEVYKTFNPGTQSDCIRNMKNIWRILFPECDVKGRIDDTITPYAVRHLKPAIERSKEKKRKDRASLNEIEQLIGYFGIHKQTQAFIACIYYGFARPQELLYTRIKDFEDMGSYGKLDISEHGKEGIKFIELFDAYPYVVDLLQKHPRKDNKEAFLFETYSNEGTPKPTNVFIINKRLRQACKILGISKPITCYSFKRNGITHSRLAGMTDVEIQHKAGWTSISQLKTYDLSRQEDTFKQEAIKRGLMQPGTTNEKLLIPTIKKCVFCGMSNKPTDSHCAQCKRPLDRKAMLEEVQQMEDLKKMMTDFKQLQGVVDLLKKFNVMGQ